MLCVFAAGVVFVFEQEVEDGRGWTGQQTKADLLRTAFTNYQLHVLPVFDFYTLMYLILHKLSTGCPTLSISKGIAICHYLFLSGPSPIIVLPCPWVSKSSYWILFKVLHGFLCCYMDLLKLICRLQGHFIAWATPPACRGWDEDFSISWYLDLSKFIYRCYKKKYMDISELLHRFVKVDIRGHFLAEYWTKQHRDLLP